jgi:selenocysteine lyase/cysteine desulfurase
MVRDALWTKYRVATALMAHSEYTGIRVTPHIYTTVRDVDFFSECVARELRNV